MNLSFQVKKEDLQKSDFSHIGDCKKDVVLEETVKRKKTGWDGMRKRRGQVLEGVALVEPQSGYLKQRARVKGHFQGHFLQIKILGFHRYVT